MQGNGPINLKVDQHSFREQADLATARAEARRLSAQLNATIVTYIPVFMVVPPRPALESNIPIPAELRDDDLPF